MPAASATRSYAWASTAVRPEPASPTSSSAGALVLPVRNAQIWSSAASRPTSGSGNSTAGGASASPPGGETLVGAGAGATGTAGARGCPHSGQKRKRTLDFCPQPPHTTSSLMVATLTVVSPEPLSSSTA